MPKRQILRRKKKLRANNTILYYTNGHQVPIFVDIINLCYILYTGTDNQISALELSAFPGRYLTTGGGM